MVGKPGHMWPSKTIGRHVSTSNMCSSFHIFKYLVRNKTISVMDGFQISTEVKTQKYETILIYILLSAGLNFSFHFSDTLSLLSVLLIFILTNPPPS